MEELTIEEMAMIEAGISWQCALSLAALGVAIVGISAAAAATGGSLLVAIAAVTGFEIAKVETIYNCLING